MENSVANLKPAESFGYIITIFFSQNVFCLFRFAGDGIHAVILPNIIYDQIFLSGLQLMYALIESAILIFLSGCL